MQGLKGVGLCPPSLPISYERGRIRKYQQEYEIKREKGTEGKEGEGFFLLHILILS